jgi:NTP pyrophosphatase (non-canonical NTP hydrolase)
MDASTTIAVLKERIRHFCVERDWDQFHAPKELAIGMVTEAAELLAHFRFRSPEETATLLADPARREEVANEMADVLYFLLRLGQVLEIDVATAFEHKMRINEARYPVDRVRGRNLKYNEL